MISHYPDFSPLSLAQKQFINNFTRDFAPYSDFNFTSLFCWNTDGTTEVSILNGNLVIRMPDYIDGHLVYTVLGTNKIDETLNILLEVCGKLDLVPEAVVEAIQEPHKYIIKDDEDNFDYIYDLSHLSHLPGEKFKKKRNKANVFVTDHAHQELEVRELDRIDLEHVEMLMQVDRAWAVQTSRAEGDILPERKALATMLANFSMFDATVTEIWVNNEIKAFSINELLSDGYAICHFEKALKVHHVHLNTFLAIEVSRQLLDAGCRYVNWEQDLGLDGLRKSKQSYHPVSMLKKFTISANS